MRSRKFMNFILGAPSFVWLVIFYALPVLIVFLLAFKPVDSYGGIGSGWTMKTIQDLGNPSYPAIIWRTLWLGVVSTAICIAVAIPISYQLSRMSTRAKNIVLLLIIVPFWTNFLIRIYAWKVFLHPDGIFKKLLVLIGLIPDSAMLLYNQWAVLAVMVYTYIPFAVLPIYASAEKFDFSLLDAAKDLGASSFYAFRRVFLPGVAKGEMNPRLPGEQVTPQRGVFVGDDGDRVRLPGRECVERQSVEEPPEVAQHFRRRMRRAVRSE